MIFVLYSCGTTRHTSSDSFYREYSKKLGVPFKGHENKEMIKAIDSWMGTPYKYGGTSKKGVDCSAFIGSVYKESLGIQLPRSAKDMAASASKIKKNNLQFGDIIFFSIKERKVSHVGLYLNDNQFVHASSSRGVVVSDLNNNYYTKYYVGAGRVANSKQTTSGQKASSQKTGFISPRGSGGKTQDYKKRKQKKPESAIKQSHKTTIPKHDEDNEVIIVFDDMM